MKIASQAVSSAGAVFLFLSDSRAFKRLSGVSIKPSASSSAVTAALVIFTGVNFLSISPEGFSSNKPVGIALTLSPRCSRPKTFTPPVAAAATAGVFATTGTKVPLGCLTNLGTTLKLSCIFFYHCLRDNDEGLLYCMH